MGQKVIRILVPVMILLTIIIIIIIPSYMAQNRNEFFYGIENGVEKGSDKYKIEERFGKINSMVLLVPRESSANMYDMKVYVEKDNVVVNIITMISIYLILAIMTKFR